MIKSVVGKVKTAQYALPDIVYGIESKIDKEGAGKGKPSILLPIEVSLSHSMFHIDSPFSFTHSNLFSHWKLGGRRAIPFTHCIEELPSNE